tara:strand:- start:870 stop:1760 length:891 start_codon:yes stop_codon:yes gene_type:complete
MGIEFLIDDEQREAEELDRIEKEIKKPRKESKNTRILRRFVISLYRAGEAKHKKTIRKKKDESLKKIVEKQFPQQIQPIKIPRIVEPNFKPSMPIPEREVEEPELPVPPSPGESEKFEENENKYPLVVSRSNNKVMASASVNDEYELIEPKLNDVDIEILRKMEKVSDRNFEKSLKKLCKQSRIELTEKYSDKIKYYLKRKLGKIGPLIKDSKISSISADGVGKSVKVVYNGKELATNINFKNIEEINDIIYRLAEKLGKKASLSSQLEGTLDTGHRVQAMLGSNEITPRFMIEKR